MRVRSLGSRLAASLTAALICVSIASIASAPRAYADCSGSGQVDDGGGAAQGSCGGGGSGGGGGGGGGGQVSAEACSQGGVSGVVVYEADGQIDPGNPEFGMGYGDGILDPSKPILLFRRYCQGPDGARVYLGTVGMQSAPVVDPLVLRDAAKARVQPVAPVPAFAPAGSSQVPSIVNLATWAWMDGGYWQARSSTEAQGGVSVTVTARPVSSSWWMGDGSGMTCSGPGRVWVDGMADAERSSCEYTYRFDSSREPGGRFHGTVSVTWQFSWTLNGVDQGVFGSVVSPPAGFDVVVDEIQVVNR